LAVGEFRGVLAWGALVVLAALLVGFFWWGYGLGEYNIFQYQQEYHWEAPKNLFLTVGLGRMLFELKLWLYLLVALAFFTCDWLAVGALSARLSRTPLPRTLAATARNFSPFLGLVWFLYLLVRAQEPNLAPLFIFIFALAWHLALQSLAIAAGWRAPASPMRARRPGASPAPLLTSSPARLFTPRRWVATAVVAAVAAGTFALFSWLNLRGYAALHVGYGDSGMFTTILYNTLHGRPFFADTVTVTSEASAKNYLGWHFSPGLLVLLPIFWLFPRHETLLVLHALFLTLAAFPIYLAARRLSGSALLGGALACGYLVAPALSHANWGNTYGFQPYSLVVLVVAWTLWAVVAERWRWLGLCVAVGLLLEEQYALILVGLGAWLVLRSLLTGGRRWLLGVALGLTGLVWFACAAYWWMPWFGAAKVSARYHAYLGATPAAMLLAVPGALLRALADWNRWEYVIHLMLPVGGLALLAPEVLLVGGPLFLIIILADNPAKYSLILGHQGPLLPMVALAAAAGARRLLERPWLRKVVSLGGEAGAKPAVLRVALAVLVVAGSLASGYFFAVSPLSRAYARASFELRYRDRLVKELEARIPQEASVCATFRVASHFAVREHLYLFPVDFDPARYPQNLGDPDFIILDFAENWTHPGAVVRGRDALWRDPHRRLLYAEEGFLLYGRGPARSAGTRRSEVLSRVSAAGAQPRQPLGQDCGFGVVLVGTDSAVTPAEPNLLRVTYYWLLREPLAEQLFVRGSVRQGERAPRRFHLMFLNGLVPPGELPVGAVVTQTNTLELSEDVTQVPVTAEVLGLVAVPEVGLGDERSGP
jgi:uncharacterized membrane protein